MIQERRRGEGGEERRVDSGREQDAEEEEEDRLSCRETERA